LAAAKTFDAFLFVKSLQEGDVVMKVCPDCHAVNRSYQSYCQKCSGALTGHADKPRLRVRLRPVRRRARPKLNFVS